MLGEYTRDRGLHDDVDVEDPPSGGDGPQHRAIAGAVLREGAGSEQVRPRREQLSNLVLAGQWGYVAGETAGGLDGPAERRQPDATGLGEDVVERAQRPLLLGPDVRGPQKTHLPTLITSLCVVPRILSAYPVSSQSMLDLRRNVDGSAPATFLRPSRD